MINTSNDINNFQKAIELICDQHAHKLSFSDKEVLELLDWQSLVNLSLVSKSFERLRKLVRYRKPEVEKYIDLRLFTNIQRCLASSFKEAFFVNKAMELARRFYETTPREISVRKHGFSFPMVPELLYYAMFLAKKEIVLEIGGASGENSAFLAYSGAKRVYMNDIVPEEVQSFKNLCNLLPPQVQEKIEPILGSCFDILQLKPELKGTVGLLLCNNLLHFFNNNEQESFFKLLKTILRPGGRAIFTAIACFGNTPEFKKIFEQSPEHTTYGTIYCYIHDYLKSQYPLLQLFFSILPLEQKSESLDPHIYYLWLKTKTTQYNWVQDNLGYSALPQETADKLKKVVESNLKFIKTLHDGSVRLVIKPTLYFREESFAALFRKAGFEVEQTFLIKDDGHLFFGENPYNGAAKVGIIIKAPFA